MFPCSMLAYNYQAGNYFIQDTVGITCSRSEPTKGWHSSLGLHNRHHLAPTLTHTEPNH